MTLIRASRRLEHESASLLSTCAAVQATELTETRASPTTRFTTFWPKIESATLRPCWVRPPSALCCDDGLTDRFSSEAGSVIGGNCTRASLTAFCRIVSSSGSVDDNAGGRTICGRAGLLRAIRLPVLRVRARRLAASGRI